MDRAIRVFSLSFVAALLAQVAWAQSQPAPRIATVFPTGGQVGTSLELSVTGVNLEDAQGLHFSFPGTASELLAQEIIKDKAPKAMKKPAKGAGVQSTVKFKVTLPGNAPLGIHDLRIVTKGGASNPRAFVIGDLPEIIESEPNNDVGKPQQVQLNCTVNGLIPTGTDVDYYAFTGKKGQRIVVSCLSTSVDSKLPVFLQLYNSTGNYLGFSKNYQADDALLDAVLPADDEYFVRVCSFTYTQGGPDYFYRLSIGTMPWIDAAFPPVVEPGKETRVTLIGRNLPKGKVDPKLVDAGKPLETETITIKAPSNPHDALTFPGYVPPSAAALAGFGHAVKNAAGSSNHVLLGFAQAPVIIESDDNDTSEKAQNVTTPCEIAGRIDKRGDRDWFMFSAKKGQAFGIEAIGDRRGAPVDLYFTLQGEKGKITEQDDNPEITSNQFYTRSDDPASYRFVAPADGDYKVMVASRYAFAQFGPRHIYTVRIASAEPDFQVVAMAPSPLAPDLVVLGKGGQQAFTVYALRQNGFTGDITLAGVDLPAGISIPPQIISGSQKQASFVVQASPAAKPFVGSLKILASATVGDQKIVREVRGASITWPVPNNNTPTIARLDRELLTSLQETAPYTLVIPKDKVTVNEGDKIVVPVSVKRLTGDFKDTVNVVALNAPPNLIVQKPLTLSPGKDSGEIVLIGKGTVAPGNFTLVLQGQTQQPQAKPNPKAPPSLNLVQAAPPIQLAIVPKALAKLNIEPKNVKVKAGADTMLTVKIERLANYQGTFKVEVINAKGLSVKEAIIPANQYETQLVVRAASATAGSNIAAVVRVTGMFNAQPVVHETKMTVNITK